ncbi:MAG: hypothetical protein DMG39_23865 [Acidobacteria bacterium]|nr:MAG: hypothetical protein DMG39_23865 [Acidobacteriota bacterium]
MALGHVTWSAACRRRCARNWYRAHNASIVGAYLKRQRLAEAETAPERFFMNVALARVLPNRYPLALDCLRKFSSAPRPFAEISGSIAFSSLWFPFPETVSNFVCHFKGSLHFKPRLSSGGLGLFDSLFISRKASESMPG